MVVRTYVARAGHFPVGWIHFHFLLTNILKKRICSTCAFIDVVSVMVRPWPVITSEIGNWSVFVLLGWRFVFGIIIKKRRARAASSDAITTLGIIKLLLYYVYEV